MTYTPPVLKLNTSFNAQTVSRGITTNRSGMASLVRNSGGIGANLLRTPSNPIGRFSRYANSRLISRMGNRPAGQVRGLSAPVVSGSYTREINFQPSSNSVNIGSVLGTLTGMVLPNILGKFGGAKQSAGDALLNQSNLSNVATTLTSSNANTQMVLNSLREASTPGELRSAIANANGTLSGMQAKTTDLTAKANMAETQKNDLQTEVETKGNAVQTLANKLNGCEGKVKKAESDKLTAEKNLEGAYKQQGITDKAYIEADKELTSATQQKDDATQNKTNKEAALNDASSELTKAEATLAKTPKTKDDGTPNEPAYSNAQRAVEQAKIKKEQCENDLKAAEQQLQKAETAVTNATKKYDEAKEAAKLSDEQVQKANTAVKTQKDALINAQKNVDDVKQEQTDMKSQHEQAQKLHDEAKAWQQTLSGAAGELQTHLQDIENVKNAITSANEKLTKMNNNEDQEYTVNQSKMNKNNTENTEIKNKYNFSDDKIDKGEKKALNKKEKNDAQNRTLSTRQNEIRRDQSDRDFITSLGQNGKGINPETGKTFYVVNGQLTTEEAYNKATAGNT